MGNNAKEHLLTLCHVSLFGTKVVNKCTTQVGIIFILLYFKFLERKSTTVMLRCNVENPDIWKKLGCHKQK